MKPGTKRMIAPTGRREYVVLSEMDRKISSGWVADDFPELTFEEANRTAMGRHKGRPGFVIASGPSVGLFSPLQIHSFMRRVNAVVWGVNNPWEVCGGSPLFTDYFITVDPLFFRRQRSAIVSYVHHFNPGCISVLAFRPDGEIKFEQIQIDLGLMARSNPPYRPDRYFHGQSSGVAAIQHAIHCGCNPIYLLGHDCRAYKGNTHGQGVRSQREAIANYPQGREMIPAYQLVKKHAQERLIAIINLSPISSLTFFQSGILE